MLYKAVATLSKRKAKVMNLNNAVPILKSKGRIEHNGIQGGPNIRSKSENMHQRKQGSPNIESKGGIVHHCTERNEQNGE